MKIQLEFKDHNATTLRVTAREGTAESSDLLEVAEATPGLTQGNDGVIYHCGASEEETLTRFFTALADRGYSADAILNEGNPSIVLKKKVKK